MAMKSRAPRRAPKAKPRGIAKGLTGRATPFGRKPAAAGAAPKAAPRGIKSGFGPARSAPRSAPAQSPASGRKSPMPSSRSVRAVSKPIAPNFASNLGQMRSAAVNKGKQGSMMGLKSGLGAARSSATPASGRRAPMVGTDRERTLRPMAPKTQITGRPRTTEGLGSFARDVSRNFGAGVGEVGRQLSGIKFGGGRKDPLATSGLGAAVNAADRVPGGNPLKKILKGSK